MPTLRSMDSEDWGAFFETEEYLIALEQAMLQFSHFFYSRCPEMATVNEMIKERIIGAADQLQECRKMLRDDSIIKQPKNHKEGKKRSQYAVTLYLDDKDNFMARLVAMGKTETGDISGARFGIALAEYLSVKMKEDTKPFIESIGDACMH